jgi:2-polyprenyl-3-methyl-5-hydroxy-6-metoxy-1,4-benzoquinol methylase
VGGPGLDFETWVFLEMSFSIELAKRGLLVRALDISRTFVDIARSNAAAEG